MLRIYSLLLSLVSFLLPISGWFSKKMRLFVLGRKGLIKHIQTTRNPNDRIIWIHAASLGEYEQAIPVIHAIRKEYPTHKIWLTFFSPSGYEIKKDTNEVDYISYLPIDTNKNAKKFIDALMPEVAIFVKYEIWPNFMHQLKKHNIPRILISALFRPNQSFFKNPNGFRTKALLLFNAIGVQNKESLELLKKIGYTHCIVSGDTRYDRVIEQTKRNNKLDFLEEFCSNARVCIVCGSTWGEDEEALLKYIQNCPTDIKFVIAPHQIQASRIEKFRNNIQKKSSLWSNYNSVELTGSSVFIIDTIGYLGRAYAYADIAYVGGAMGTTGLHNILEPATFGIPVLYGKNIDKHPEADDLANADAGFFVSNSEEVNQLLNKMVSDVVYRKEKGNNAQKFIQQQAGATEKSMQLLRKFIK